jgi:hypothetical protein
METVINNLIKGQRIKEVYATVPHESPSLGLSLQWMPLSATEDVWHVLEVAANSPADLAGLLPYGDYIIGSPGDIIRGEAGIPELVEEVNQPLYLLVSPTTNMALVPRETSAAVSI